MPSPGGGEQRGVPTLAKFGAGLIRSRDAMAFPDVDLAHAVGNGMPIRMGCRDSLSAPVPSSSPLTVIPAVSPLSSTSPSHPSVTCVSVILRLDRRIAISRTRQETRAVPRLRARRMTDTRCADRRAAPTTRQPLTPVNREAKDLRPTAPLRPAPHAHSNPDKPPPPPRRTAPIEPPMVMQPAAHIPNPVTRRTAPHHNLASRLRLGFAHLRDGWVEASRRPRCENRCRLSCPAAEDDAFRQAPTLRVRPASPHPPTKSDDLTLLVDNGATICHEKSQKPDLYLSVTFSVTCKGRLPGGLQICYRPRTHDILAPISTAIAGGLMATITWQAGVGGDWSTSASWSGDTIPGSGDIAVFSIPGSYTVTITTPEAAQSVTPDASGINSAITSALADRLRHWTFRRHADPLGAGGPLKEGGHADRRGRLRGRGGGRTAGWHDRGQPYLPPPTRR